MIKLTKIFHFEMAHAIHGYNGPCKNIHGHSYELHVTVATRSIIPSYIPDPGFIIDFKELAKIVSTSVIVNFDHKLMLSRPFVNLYPSFPSLENLVIVEFEPTVENMLILIKDRVNHSLSDHLSLLALKLYETKSSYAEWTDTNLL